MSDVHSGRIYVSSYHGKTQNTAMSVFFSIMQLSVGPRGHARILQRLFIPPRVEETLAKRRKPRLLCSFSCVLPFTICQVLPYHFILDFLFLLLHVQSVQAAHWGGLSTCRAIKLLDPVYYELCNWLPPF